MVTGFITDFMFTILTCLPKLHAFLFSHLPPCLPMLRRCIGCYGYAKALVMLQLRRCPTLFNIYFSSQTFGGTRSEKVKKQSTKLWLDPRAVRVIRKIGSGTEISSTILYPFVRYYYRHTPYIY